jgi:siroheme synthase-like protein
MDETRAKPYPIVLTQLEQARCVVVGGGEVAVRKVRALLDSHAQVKVISPEIHPQLAEWRDAARISHEARPYATSDLDGAFLVVAATNQRIVNAAIADDARQRGMLYNIADDPAAGNFHTLGAVMRGDVLLAVATGGDSPALAAYIRRKLEATFGPEYGVLAHRLGALRRELGTNLPAPARTRLWRTLVSDEVLEWVRTGDQARLEHYITALVAELSEA